MPTQSLTLRGNSDRRLTYKELDDNFLYLESLSGSTTISGFTIISVDFNDLNNISGSELEFSGTYTVPDGYFIDAFLYDSPSEFSVSLGLNNITFMSGDWGNTTPPGDSASNGQILLQVDSGIQQNNFIFPPTVGMGSPEYKYSATITGTKTYSLIFNLYDVNPQNQQLKDCLENYLNPVCINDLNS